MKPITYKDNVSELVSISIKEAMQMLIDNDCEPVDVLDSDGQSTSLIGVRSGINPFFMLSKHAPFWDIAESIYRREEYVLGYNGEKLPPLPDGYGLVPGGTTVPINSDKWRALFPPELQIEEGKWYECEDGSVVKVIGCVNSAHWCSDRAVRLKNGEVLFPSARENGQIIREIDPQLSLSDLDHATANMVWRAMKC